jgi:hypothetical protein
VARARDALALLASPAAVRALAARMEDVKPDERVTLARGLGNTRSAEAWSRSSRALRTRLPRSETPRSSLPRDRRARPEEAQARPRGPLPPAAVKAQGSRASPRRRARARRSRRSLLERSPRLALPRPRRAHARHGRGVVQIPGRREGRARRAPRGRPQGGIARAHAGCRRGRRVARPRVGVAPAPPLRSGG